MQFQWQGRYKTDIAISFPQFFDIIRPKEWEMQIPSPPVSPMAKPRIRKCTELVFPTAARAIADSLSDDHGIHKAVKLLKRFPINIGRKN